MSAFTPAETLREHRPLFLAMEAIGWFHMAGKARSEFLRYHGGDRVDYKYEKWHDYEIPTFPWDDLLGWVRSRFQSKVPSNAWPGSFREFTEKHRERNLGLLGLLQAGHGIVSGVEKNLPGATSEYLSQSVLHMWLSSPWGYPKRNLLVDPPEVLTPNGWKQVVSETRRILEELKNLGTQDVQDVDAWWRWREEAISPDSFIRRAFLSTLAETRLPNNDVTLWDQSYVAAALFKSAVAGALLNSDFPWGDRQIKQKARWRLLTVAIGTEHYEARAVKIGDWTGMQAALERFFEEVCKLIEVDLAVGSLLYRDSSAAVFSFPGEREDENVPAPWLSGWEEWLQEQIDKIAKQLDLETPPEVRLSQPTRSLVPMVRERAEAVKSTMVPVHRAWSINASEMEGHVCPVCGVRCNGDPTSKGKPCAVCRDRRHRRRNDWLSGRLGYDTIWFEEAADSNGRLAVLTLSLDLEPWLDGERVDSLRAQAISEWAKFNPVLSEYWQRDESKRRYEGNPIHQNDMQDRLISELKRRFYDQSSNFKFNENDLLLANLNEGYRHQRSKNPKSGNEKPEEHEERLWRLFFQHIVEDRAESPTWDNLSDEERAAWLAHQLFCKLPSPGRVYRFWREAIEFFEDLLREFRQIASQSDNPWRVRRLLLIPDASTAHGWKNGMLYDGRWRGAQISLVYVQALNGFVTASNLARLLKPEERKEVLQNQTITVEEEDTFGQPASLTVRSVEELGGHYAHLGVYHPVIPLEVSPLRFRVVLPLEAASECVDLAIARWRERFARVWDRLPLRAGVMAFPRAMSFQAVVEAVRNVEEALRLPAEIWRIEETQIQEGVLALSLRRKDGQNTLWCVPLRLPDGREDVFYPYVEVEDRRLRYPRDFRHPGSGRVFRHVADLRLGDGIRVAPATIVAIWMESTAVRFEPLKSRYLEDWTRMREVWHLVERVAPSTTAIQRLRSALIELQERWRTLDGSWTAPEDLRRDTIRAFLAEHLEVRGADLETLVEAAMEGLLLWAFDWHLTALRERT
jgi:CRISPR-associated Csx11 family protein